MMAEPAQEIQEKFNRTHVATCVILLEIAKSDDEFSSVEQETTKAILQHEFSIPEEDIEDLMKIAAEKRDDSVDLWEFTNLINQKFSEEEKKRIVESAWRVIYSDEKLDKYEDHLVHVLAKLLRLDHSDLIEAKLRILYSENHDAE
jgi:uncharacterized tellurite resistance protein B-like protein